jgi:hypothetical protein
MALDGETTKTKVVDLEKLCNFVVDNFFIWIRLESQTLISSSVQHNISTKNIWYRHKWVLGGVVRGGHTRLRSWVRNPAAVKRAFLCEKMRIATCCGAGVWLLGGASCDKILILLFFDLDLWFFEKRTYMGGFISRRPQKWLAAPANSVCRGGCRTAPINRRSVGTTRRGGR